MKFTWKCKTSNYSCGYKASIKDDWLYHCMLDFLTPINYRGQILTNYANIRDFDSSNVIRIMTSNFYEVKELDFLSLYDYFLSKALCNVVK